MNAHAYNALIDAFSDAGHAPGRAIARGEIDFQGDRPLPSEIEGVSDEAWTAFVHALATESLTSVSPHNELGLFKLGPRRLADLGIVSKKRLRRNRSAEGKTRWVSSFVPPLTAQRFLQSPWQQYRALVRSLRDYAGRMAQGEIVRPPQLSFASALAVLHRAGPKGLESWTHGRRLPATEALVKKVEGLF